MYYLLVDAPIRAGSDIEALKAEGRSACKQKAALEPDVIPMSG